MGTITKALTGQSGIKTLRVAGQALAFFGGLQLFVMVVFQFLNESFDFVLFLYSIIGFIITIMLLGASYCLATIAEIQLNNYEGRELSDSEDSKGPVVDLIVPGNGHKFKENDLVVLAKTGRQMRVKGVTVYNKYSCYTNNGTVHQGDFDESELKLFGEK